MHRPLWPEDGFQYDVAMMQAQEEYDAWVDSRRGGNGNRKGITIYSRKQINKEEND